LLQVGEAEVRRDSCCPGCGAVFCPADILPGFPAEETIPTAALPTENEQIQDLFLQKPTWLDAKAEAAAWRRTKILLMVAFIWFPFPCLCVSSSLIDWSVGVINLEPGSLLGLVIMLAFGASLLSLWMCSNANRPPLREDAEQDSSEV
jgi:hypothetical protein